VLLAVSLSCVRLFVVIIPLLVMLPAAAAAAVVTVSTPPKTYESVEFLEGVAERTAVEDGGGSHYTIDTRAFWLDKPSLAVAVASSDGASDAAVQSVKDMISGKNITMLSGPYSQWNDLLSVFQQAAVPRLSLADEDASANIKVVLTDAAQQDNKPGKTRLLADKATGEIVQAEVYVYSADKLYGQGMLEYVVAHELGHALGLSHSTDPKSMMYPLMEVEDGHVVNQLGLCEIEGISALYLESRIGSENC
jgi:hypothetical protein